MTPKFYLFALLLLALSCKKEVTTPPTSTPEKSTILSADLSALPQIEASGAIFYAENGQPEDVLTTLQRNGVNTIRLRLWHSPNTPQSSLNEVQTFAQKIHSKGLKVWLTVHYSDTWADPAHQTPPLAWQNIPFVALKDSVRNYTQQIMTRIKPDFIQIGNEINGGFLLPYGNISTNETQFLELLATGTQAVRNHSTDTKIILHFAGIEGANWFFNKTKNIDYDIIGLSYYPIWHGKNLDTLKTSLQTLSNTYQKNTVIAETAYPFTLGWNDWTNNIVGLESQLILPDYPATPEGQQLFFKKIKEIATASDKNIGCCYWGGELIAHNGAQATNGSPWENQALYDFNNKALPVITAFKP